MSYEDDDDTSIENNVVLWRRINPIWVNYDDNGNPFVTSQAFQNAKPENHEKIMIPAGYKHSPALSVAFSQKTSIDDYLAKTPGYYLVEFTAGEVRGLNQTIQETSLIDEPAHGSVIGNKKKNAVKKGFKRISRWVVAPDSK